MEQDILEKFENQEKKMEEIRQSVEKIRRYFFWTFMVTIISIAVPLLIIILIIPWIISFLSSSYSSLGL